MGRPWAYQGLLRNGGGVGGDGDVACNITQNAKEQRLHHSRVIWAVTVNRLNGRVSVTRSGRNFLTLIKCGLTVVLKDSPPPIVNGTQGSFRWNNMTEVWRCWRMHGVLPPGPTCLHGLLHTHAIRIICFKNAHRVSLYMCVCVCVCVCTAEQCNIQTPIMTQYMQPHHHRIDHTPMYFNGLF